MLVLAGVLAVALLVGWKIRTQLTSSKLVFILLLAFVTAIVLLFVLGHFLLKPPKEDKVVAKFYAHRATYEQLRKMILEDKDLDEVATWGIRRTGSPTWALPPDGDISGNRFQEYLGLLKEIDAPRVDRGENPLKVRILIWGSGFAGDTRHVAIVWLAHEPPNIVGSLDEFYKTPKPRSPVYRHIVDNWYIWADW